MQKYPLEILLLLNNNWSLNGSAYPIKTSTLQHYLLIYIIRYEYNNEIYQTEATLNKQISI